uniref:Uncharacterized protein n=1 Tax=Rhizophagus irregularis (strain DAOM 181602 / DAOM 197198 / MUCL 43194) TaxID=747089 RepID=U9UUB5_RHIID
MGLLRNEQKSLYEAALKILATKFVPERLEVDFWDLAKGDTSELSQFALYLYGICVNLASVERLWLNMGFLHSKRQNRLNISIEKSEKLYKKNHIATPIQPYKTSDSEENGYSDIEEYNDNDIIQVSDKDDTHLRLLAET